jgi:DNA mismatch repair ATPase MutL
VQVIDNGKGMSVTDSRLCFERHATSKIRQAEDLFSLKKVLEEKHLPLLLQLLM